MTYKKYLTLVNECKNYETAEAILAEYGFPADCEFSADGLIKAFDIIFAASRGDIAEIIKLSGGNVSAFSRKHNIPLRTINGWASGERKAPEYVIQMLGFAMISECEREEENNKTI